MDALCQLQRRELVYQFWRSHQDKGKAYIVHHFMLMGFSSSGLYSMLDGFEKNGDCGRRSENGGSGGHNRKIPLKQQQKLVQEAEDKIGISQRKLATKYKLSQSRVQQLLRQDGLEYRKRQKGAQNDSRSRGQGHSLLRNSSSPFLSITGIHSNRHGRRDVFLHERRQDAW
jgi:transposase